MKKEPSFNPGEDPSLELRERVEIGTASLPDERHPEKNEDAVLVDRKRMLFGVFDGLGGHNAGEIASRAAREFVEKWADEIKPDMSAEEAADTLGQILEDANDYVFTMSKKPEYMDMGSTAAVVKLLESGGRIMAVVGHVGDSRVYRLSPEGKLQEVTLDDSPIRDQFHDERQAREAQRRLSNISNFRDLGIHERSLFASRNRVSQFLGRAKIVPHTQALEVRAGDILILTSDGVHDNLTDKEIEEICISSSGSREAAVRLTANSFARSRESKERNIRAHPDDMSAVVVKISEK